MVAWSYHITSSLHRARAKWHPCICMFKRATIETAVCGATRLKTRLFTWFISGAFKTIGAGARVCPPLRCSGLHRITVGNGTIIHRDCWLQTIGDSAVLDIGCFAGIGMGASISAAERITIADHVILGRNVYIADHAHAFDDISVPISTQGINNLAPVSIGRSTWLCQNVVILPGVSIGQHCVVGANSVVRSSIPDFSVAVGSPARVVKHYNTGEGKWEKVKQTA